MKTAIVAGATGAIGKALLYQLIEDNRYLKIIALSRKPITVKHHKLSNVIVDFDKLQLTHEHGADDVFCCLGTTIKQAGSQEAFYKIDHDCVVNFAKQCKQLGATQFILVTAMGANADAAIFYNKVKGETELSVANVGFKTFITVRPSLLLTKRNEFRLGEAIMQPVMRLLQFVFVGPLKQYKAIKVETVAAAMRYYANTNLTGKHVFLNDKLFV